MKTSQERRIAVVGLGYVGLPIAVAFGRVGSVIGFDINQEKVDELSRGVDRTGVVLTDELRTSRVHYTADATELKRANFIIVAVPTPINDGLQPDLRFLIKACELIGANLSSGTVVVYESTVFPGATEEVCVPIVERRSGLRCGVDFTVGYSPERINPGDKEHTLEKIIKVVAGQDGKTLDFIADTYGLIVKAGIHRAPSIKVAEAAKVIENTQRDLNIALMNELALIFHRLGLDTQSVLEAAATKWNFHKFSPGLVGGHCIGIDPYYLTAKAESVGYHPEVILAGRRINNGMGKFVAEQAMKLLTRIDRSPQRLRIVLLGLTFKEDVPDIRNSRVPDIIRELREYGITVLIHDPLADPDEAKAEYGLQMVEWNDIGEVDGMILAVPHAAFIKMDIRELLRPLSRESAGVLLDVKAALDPSKVPPRIRYWRL